MFRTHLDTRGRADSAIMCLGGPGMEPAKGEEGLIITSSFRLGGRFLDLMILSPDGEIHIEGRRAVEHVQNAISEALTNHALHVLKRATP